MLVFYLGAFEDHVEYISVVGKAVTGRLSLLSNEQVNINWVDRIQSLVAYVSYYFLCGQGDVKGDGNMFIAAYINYKREEI
jgi:hypothetical protein